MTTDPHVDALREEPPSPLEPSTRRGLLRAGLAGTVAAGLLGQGRARAQGSGPSMGGSIPEQVDPLLALIHHATQGFSQASYQEAQAMGYAGWLQQQLNPGSIDDSAMDAMLAQFPTLNMTAADLLANYPMQMQGIVVNELRRAAILRSLFSKRQLYERMVEFWTDHFNIDQQDGPVRYLKTVDDREVIRAHALGKFPELLSASAHSGAMLHYLDNHTNVKDGPQENYARELMELHTLGSNGGFTEMDVKEVARALTGWTHYPVPSPQFGTFLFLGPAHDNGPKQVLGQTIPPFGGEADGDQVLQILAAHPSTADYVARKIARWLLTYDPPERVVLRTKQRYVATGGDIRAMVAEVLSPQSLAEAAPWANPKLRRPFHFAVGVMRATGAQVGNAGFLPEELRRLGQAPFDWPAPNGYPDALGAWGSSVLPRWNFASRLLDNQIPGVQISTPALLSQMGNPVQGQVAQAADVLLTGGGGISPYDRGVVQSFVNTFPFASPKVIREAVALAASSPSYQYY